ncbi:MAG: TetR/AcrR family transcriptional regulator [Actinobacteria bacterium]|nr:TetR/AcrR family transcriptional regulator [Actinomycetota bacterium]
MGIYERRQREKNSRIEAILDSAEKLISKEGFNSFTLSRLAKDLELSRGIIYYYFKNEENIIAKLIADKMVLLFDILKSIPEDLNGYDSIKSVLEKFHGFLKKEVNYLNLISYFTTCKLSKMDIKHIPYYQEYEILRDKIFNVCLKSIEKGVADGSIDADVNPPVATYAIWAGVGSFWEFMLKDNVLREVKLPYLKRVDIFLQEYFRMIFKALKCC